MKRWMLVFSSVALVLFLAACTQTTAEFDLLGGRPLSADLSGGAEVPPSGSEGSGTALVEVNPGLGQVCYELTVEGIAPAFAAHIHAAPAGVNGGVVVPLSPPTDGSSSGCVEDVDRELALNILKNPHQYYVNVHNAETPSGVLRGQLSK